MISKKQQNDELRLTRLRRRVEAQVPRERAIMWGMYWIFNPTEYIEAILDPFLQYIELRLAFDPKFQSMVLIYDSNRIHHFALASNKESDLWPIVSQHIAGIINAIHDHPSNPSRGYMLICPTCKTSTNYNDLAFQQGSFVCPKCRKG